MAFKDYNLIALVDDLKEIMRLKDWDMVLLSATQEETEAEGLAEDTRGFIYNDYTHRESVIKINIDHEECKVDYSNEQMSIGWFYTLIHEMMHIILCRYSKEALFNVDIIKNQSLADRLSTSLEMEEEALVNNLAKMFFNLVNVEEFLSRYRRADINDETETTE